MSDEVKAIIKETVTAMLTRSMADKNIRQLRLIHNKKIHFMPFRYRVINGVLQGLNIKLGNLIEFILKNVIELDTRVKVMEDSGRKIRLFFTPNTDTLIDNYITKRKSLNRTDNSAEAFEELLQNILEIERQALPEEREWQVKDVEGLFQTDNGQIVYTEIKYNDDHDTGKFADINRKFIKTWAGLAVRHNIQSADQLLPILYYFNSKQRYKLIYMSSANILRGPQLFDRYLHIKYDDIGNYLSEISDDPDIVAIFDKMYNSVRYSNSGQSDFFSTM